MRGVAILGAGFIGGVHAECIARAEGVRLVCVYDRDEEAGHKLAERSGVRAAASAEDAINDEGVDLVLISASSSAHGELVRLVLSAGKDYLCEKPLDVDFARARELVLASEEAGIFAGMAFNRRFDAQHLALRRMVPRLGRIELMHMTSRSSPPTMSSVMSESGGLLREKGSHFFDLACWLTGERPREIFVSGGCLVDAAYGEGGDIEVCAHVQTDMS